MYDMAICTLAGISNMTGKNLIEVGCGRGGCLKYITDKLKPKQAIGIDFSS